MNLEAKAKSIVDPLCGEGFLGFGVVYTFSPILCRIPNRRSRAQDKEQSRLGGVVNTIVERLRMSYDVPAAAVIADTEGFSDCISITNSYEGLIASVVQRFTDGDNVWDGEMVGDDIVRIYFYPDKSHSRVF